MVQATRLGPFGVPVSAEIQSISATLAVTEAPDIVAFSVAEIAGGTFVAAEAAADTAALSGDVIAAQQAVQTGNYSGGGYGSAWQHAPMPQAKPQRVIQCDFLLRDAPDRAALSAAIVNSGTLACTERRDRADISGQIVNAGTFRTMEAADRASMQADTEYIAYDNEFLLAA